MRSINGVLLYDVIKAMKSYGGSFACAIAEAAEVADSGNLDKLLAAFPDLFGKYAEKAWQPSYLPLHCVDNDIPF